jgi:DNA-binding NtrC family response regulator
MQLLGDRFLSTGDRGEALDVATNAEVRLFVDADVRPAAVAARMAACDRLALLRHPLLRPLVDYGVHGRVWFEAHDRVPPARMTADQRRIAVLHVVRFLRAAGVELGSGQAERNVRTAVDGVAAWRPLGVFLRERPALEAVRTLLEGAGPPGATAIDLIAPPGGGLRTARILIARMARLAGFVVVDARAAAAAEVACAGRHVCALDWLPRGRTLPPAIAAAAVSGGRRHVWIRFCRAPLPPSAAARVEVRLEPMMSDDMVAAIFLDTEQGPVAGAVRLAAEQAHGWPGPAIEALTGFGRGGAGWVHETSPEYGAAPQPRATASVRMDEAGTARFRRAVEAVRGLAARGRHAHALRVLTRAIPALAARGAFDEASGASCDLGDLMLARGRPARALDAYGQARAWTRQPGGVARAMIGSGRALLDLARLAEAEGVFRTAMSADAGGSAQVWLARTLWIRGEFDAARVAAGDRSPALLVRILLDTGRIEDAGAVAQAALARIDAGPPEEACEAHVAIAHLHASTRDGDGVRRHMDDALGAARSARRPALRILTEAERVVCLERCGVAGLGRTRERLLRAARHLPPLASTTIRTILQRPASVPRATASDRQDLVRYFQLLIDATHDTPDEAAALQVIATSLLKGLAACSVAIRSAKLNQVVASAGRPWAGEPSLSATVLSGAAAMTRDGVTPEAVEPIAAAGAVIGSLAVRWVAGANPSHERVRDLLRATAAAAAPLVRAMKPVEPAPSARVSFPDDLLGRGDAAERVREAIRRAASAPYPVLIEGESGSGKELVARAIHARSVRRARRFCAVNCAALTDDLLEAELFGHARGSFTGALTERAGLFEDADQGTLFLDEVGELSARAQAKLLRVLQESEVRRVGENLPRKIDVRVVAASNRSLEHEVPAGRFRGDLRFRLDVIRIVIPPLRERADDLPWLAERIWHDAAGRVGSRAVLGPDVMGALARYDWPGNVRELQNVIASLAVHGPRRGRMPAALLPARIAHEAAGPELGFDEARVDFERRFVRAALARAGGQRALAAEHLRVSRQGLTKIMRRLGLD